MDRDFDKKPYTPEEQRVADYFLKYDLGGGNDPIGSLIAMHEYLAFQIKQMREIMKSKGIDYLSDLPDQTY